MDDLLSIGEVARQSAVPTSTLRYYDELGLVRPAARVSGQRRYAPEAVRRLRIIGLCQRAGFTLDQIAGLLDGGAHVQRLATAKLAELDDRIAELHEARTLVTSALECGCTRLEACGRTAHAVSHAPDEERLCR